MKWLQTPWGLPSAEGFLAEAALQVDAGGAVLIRGPSQPAGAAIAFSSYLSGQGGREFIVRSVCPTSDELPAEAVAFALGSSGLTAQDLVCDLALQDHVALVELGPLADSEMTRNQWFAFLRRFLTQRTKSPCSLSIFLFASTGPGDEPSFPIVRWGGRLKRLDTTIWADLHAPANRKEPMARLAEALAVELGVWRLDIAAQIAAATHEDLLDIGGLLTEVQLRDSDAVDDFDGASTECTLNLLRRGETATVNHRIWRAQLRALFPWIEEIRQRVIERHRSRLAVTPQQREMGARTIEDIEFGGIAHQLAIKVPNTEYDLLRALARLRNDLAHHRPVAKADVQHVLQNLGRSGYA